MPDINTDIADTALADMITKARKLECEDPIAAIIKEMVLEDIEKRPQCCIPHMYEYLASVHMILAMGEKLGMSEESFVVRMDKLMRATAARINEILDLEIQLVLSERMSGEAKEESS